MTRQELEVKAKEFDSKLKRHPMSSEELQKVLCDFAEALRIKTELELRQIFKNLSDCYADTWHSERGFMEEGEVIQAMTEDRFIEALKEAKLLPIPVVVGQSEQLVCKCQCTNSLEYSNCSKKCERIEADEAN